MTKTEPSLPLRVSAPGKLVLAGEYAVLQGHSAVVAAIARRVYVTKAEPIAQSPLTAQQSPGSASASSPYFAAVLATLGEELGAAHPGVQALSKVTIDSKALYHGDDKLGLGSSAATTVAAVAYALAVEETPITPDQAQWWRARTHQLAHLAHAHAQATLGHGGSGIDIAAATWGHYVRFDPRAPGAFAPLPAPPPTVQWVPFWAGEPASTPSYLRAYEAAKAKAPSAHAAAIDSLAGAAEALERGLRQVDGAACIAAVRLGYDAMLQLQAVVEAPLVPDAAREVARLAEQLGGAAKTCGAGGGDVALAMVPTAQASRLQAELTRRGIATPALELDAEGVRWEVG